MKITYDVLEDLLVQMGDDSGHDPDTVAEWVATAIPTITNIEGRDWVVVDSPRDLIHLLVTAVDKLEAL